MITKETLLQIFKKVIHKIKLNDSFLLKNNVHEISISSKFACYLEEEIKNTCGNDFFKNNNLHIDIEYNKSLNSNKVNKDGIGVRPDIILHQRGDNEKNILLIELKKDSSESDETKIDKMTNLQYKFYSYIANLIGNEVKIGIKEPNLKREFFAF